jgi:hypothetical protein
MSPGTLGEPIVQPLEKAPIPAIIPQYTIYFGKFNSRESIFYGKRKKYIKEKSVEMRSR